MVNEEKWTQNLDCANYEAVPLRGLHSTRAEEATEVITLIINFD